MSSSNDLSLTIPDKTVERQQTRRNVQHRPRGLLRCTGVDDSHTTVVSSEGKGISAGGEGNALNPTSSIIQVFTTDGVERETLSPSAGLRAGVDTLNEAGEDTGMGIGGSSCQQNRVRVPSQGCDGATDRLLQVLRDPPVVLLLKVTDSDHSSTGADSELLLRGRPAHECCSTVDSEKDEGGLPARGGLLPDVGIAVYAAPVSDCMLRAKNRLSLTLRASNNPATVGSNVNTGDGLLVALEFITQRKLVA
jgi:hypothetical protein